MKAPRRQPYVFAHRLLPELFHARPEWFREKVAAHGEKFLLSCWRQAGFWWARFRKAPRLHHQEMQLDDGSSILVISPPAPEGITEAYFVGLVYAPRAAESRSRTLVFTLELGMNVDGGPRTVLAGWSPGEKGMSHVNYGDGPAPTLEAFLESVLKFLEGDTAPKAVS